MPIATIVCVLRSDRLCPGKYLAGYTWEYSWLSSQYYSAELQINGKKAIQ